MSNSTTFEGIKYYEDIVAYNIYLDSMRIYKYEGYGEESLTVYSVRHYN
jgi:hypothetical protein